MLKRKSIALFLTVAIMANFVFMSIPSYASAELDNNNVFTGRVDIRDNRVKLISETEYNVLVNQGSTQNVQRRIDVCCNQRPAFSWRRTGTGHIYPDSGGLCLGVIYIGDKICTYCGTIWEREIVYESLPGCGRLHANGDIVR